MLIKESNKEKIEKMITEAEGRARERKITYADMVHGIKKIEGWLGIPKAHMEGIVVYVDHNAQNFPNAYKYTPYSTQYMMVRKRSGWDLRQVYRDITRRDNHTYELELTDKAKESIIEAHRNF